MDKILLLYLDKLTYAFPQPLPANIKQVCFPPPPDIHFYSNAIKELESYRKSNIKIILAACGDERKVKECLLSLNAFPLFDYLIIPDEIKKGCSIKEQKKIIDSEVKRLFIRNSLFFSYTLYFQDFVGKRIEIWREDSMIHNVKEA